VALATYPQARPSRPQTLAYLVLLRMEVARFTRTACAVRLVSVALFVTSPCQGITLHPALRSPDFPLPAPSRGKQRLPGRLP